MTRSLALSGLILCACGGATPRSVALPSGDPTRAAIDAVLDDFHAAAAASDEERYFAHFAEGGVFLGTDATERWDVTAFRAYAHAPFSEGRGWVMTSVRRDVVVRGDVAWFDEDLDTRNLGPSRGSGVLVREGGTWRIAQYNLAITVPNERFGEVRALLSAAAP
jgi:hypothetical protein